VGERGAAARGRPRGGGFLPDEAPARGRGAGQWGAGSEAAIWPSATLGSVRQCEGKSTSGAGACRARSCGAVRGERAGIVTEDPHTRTEAEVSGMFRSGTVA
jgi:hypothetical protein